MIPDGPRTRADPPAGFPPGIDRRWAAVSPYFALPWAVALVGLGLGLVLPGWMDAAAPWVFLGSALLLGLPHGAADPWIPQWTQGERWPWRRWCRFLLLYLLATGVAVGLWRWQRGWAAVGFLLLTVWHWGSADASGLLPPRNGRWVGLALGRGLVVVAGPLTLAPEGSAAVLTRLAGDRDVVEAVLALARPALAVGVLLEAVTLSLSALGRVTEPGAWRRPLAHGVETGLLLATFSLLPPAAAVGIYFVAFHAWRHLERLAELRAAVTAEPPAKPWRRLGRFYAQVWPLALAALAGLPLLRIFLGTSPDGEADWLTPYLVLLSALTVPHAAVVFRWLDRHR